MLRATCRERVAALQRLLRVLHRFGRTAHRLGAIGTERGAVGLLLEELPQALGRFACATLRRRVLAKLFAFGALHEIGDVGDRVDELGRALDDLPGLARRFLRWQARRDFFLAAGRTHRVTALRPGRPPGGRLARYDPDAWGRRKIRDVDRVLARAHALAHEALRPDTS